MKKMALWTMTLAAVAVMVVVVGCEWEESTDFNTSRGAGVSVNFSGVYKARDGAILGPTNLTQLVMTQTGNALEVLDNRGRRFTGSIGAPGVMSPDNTSGSFSAGAEMLQAQVTFATTMDTASPHDDVTFVGVIRAVAVSDVSGVNATTTQTSNSGTNTTVTITDDNLDPTFDLNNEISSENSTENTTTDTTVYTITDANTQYVLEGTWMEWEAIYTFNGFARASVGTF